MSGPRYDVTIRLTGTDGNAMMIIGRVGAALRESVGPEAAREYAGAAMDCGSYDELLRFTMSTVNVE